MTGRSVPHPGGRHTPPGHARRPRSHLDRLRHLASGGLFLIAPQPVEPLRPDLRRGRHGNRHGAHHRLAQHRPLGRLRGRRRRHVHGPLAGPAHPDALGLGFEQPYTWIVTVRLRAAAGRGHRRAAGRARRLRRHPVVRRHAGRPARLARRDLPCWPPARRSRRWTRPSSCSVAGPRARSVRPSAGSSAIVVCVAIVYAMITGRRRRQRLRLPGPPHVGRRGTHRSWAAPPSWEPWVANSYPWPKRLADAVRGRERHRRALRAASSSRRASPTRCSSCSGWPCS